MQAEPLVSVIVPAFNAERWISETLRSVLSQTHASLQVIVVDDGSTDATAEKVCSFSDARISLISQANQGAAAARNRGLGLASGDLIQFLDADDILGPDKIEQQVAALRAQEPNTIASGWWGRFPADFGGPNDFSESVWQTRDPVEWLISSFSGGGMMQTAAWLTPRRVVEAAGPWNEALTLHDDGEFFTRVLLAADRNLFVAKAKVFYRDVPGSLSRLRNPKAIESALMVCQLQHRHLLARCDTTASRRALATQYARFIYEHECYAPDLAFEARKSLADLGVEPNSSIGGQAFRLVSATLGFDHALRLRSVVGGVIG